MLGATSLEARTAPAQATPAAILTVLTGRHAGATVELPAGQSFLIGADPACDIILDDASLAGRQATVTARGRDARLEALSGGVALETGEPLSEGRVRALRLPARVTVGAGVTIHLDEVRGEARPGGRRWPVSVLLAAVLAVLAAVPAVSGGASLALRGSAQLVDGATAETARHGVRLASREADGAQHGDAAPPARAPDRTTRTREAIEALHSRLDAAGLGSLRVEVRDDVVRVTGTLTPEQQPRWRAIGQWYDESYGADLTLVPSLGSAAADALPGRPVAVWLGPRAYILGVDGTRYGVGSVTADGWKVEAISPAGADYAKGERHVTVKF